MEDAALDEADLYVDALFGTGLTRPVDGLFAEAIALALNDRADRARNCRRHPVGPRIRRSDPIGPHVHADLTVTFTAPKPACVLPPAAFACGLVATRGSARPPSSSTGWDRR